MHSKETDSILGLVLAGGKSVRMGIDKATISWHGKEQQYYIADLIKPLCSKVYISCREEQAQTIHPDYNVIKDKFPGSGPYGAILSAFTEHPDKAWLVIACDLPLLDTETLHQLISERDANALATTFKSPYDGLPEPLITIWEPNILPVLQTFLSEGISCPRKVLKSQIDKIKIITPNNPESLTNTNTPDDAKIVTDKLNSIKAQNG